jgi:hypothetical protein
MKKEDNLKKWINLNNPSSVKKSKLSLLDQIKVNLIVDIFYDMNNDESVRINLTEKSTKNKTNGKSTINTSLSQSNNNSLLFKTLDKKLDLGSIQHEIHKLSSARGEKSVNYTTQIKRPAAKKKSADDKASRNTNRTNNISDIKKAFNTSLVSDMEKLENNTISEKRIENMPIAKENIIIDPFNFPKDFFPEEYDNILNDFKDYYNVNFIKM